MPAVDDATRVLRLHLALAALGMAAIALIVIVVASAVSFQPPGVAASESHWQLVRSALTVGSVGTLALGSLSLAVGMAAADSLWRQRRRSRAFVGALRPVGRTDAVTVVQDERPLAFCTGLRRPRVYVSTTTLSMLGPRELTAVLAHEHHHAQRHDPLRLFMVRALADALFFLPVLGRLAQRYAALVEVCADRAALQRTGGDPAPLASALLSFDERTDSAVVGIDPVRVDHLCGEQTHWQLPLALVAGTALVLSGVVVATLRAAEASQELTLNIPLLAEHLCLIAVDLGPLLTGAGALLFARSLLTRRSDRCA